LQEVWHWVNKKREWIAEIDEELEELGQWSWEIQCENGDWRSISGRLQ
jgi:hypothetical protein